MVNVALAASPVPSPVKAKMIFVYVPPGGSVRKMSAIVKAPSWAEMVAWPPPLLLTTRFSLLFTSTHVLPLAQSAVGVP